jgi:hypothetical protein
VGALADGKVGEFVGSHFVAAYKKVGTFRKDGDTKNGGNVATYFCLSDGTVLHVIPGRVDAVVFLREARWAVDVYESAKLEHRDDRDGQKEYLKLAHGIRYLTERGRGPIPGAAKGVSQAKRVDASMPKLLPRGIDTLTQAHWLLWLNPMPQLSAVYRTVWTDILNEQVTDAPVQGR